MSTTSKATRPRGVIALPRRIHRTTRPDQSEISMRDLRRREAVARLVAFDLDVDEIAAATELPRAAILNALAQLARGNGRAAADATRALARCGSRFDSRRLQDAPEVQENSADREGNGS